MGSNDTNNSLEKIKGISVENSFMEEKEQAVLALKEMCKHCGLTFGPFLYEALEETFKILDTPDDDVKKAGLEAIAEFLIAYHQMGTPQAGEVFQKSIIAFVPRLVLTNGKHIHGHLINNLFCCF